MKKLKNLRATAELWVDLTKDARFESPHWHLDELRATEARVAAGKEEFIAWDVAKKSLRRRAK